MKSKLASQILLYTGIATGLGSLCISMGQRIYPFSIPFIVTLIMCFIAGFIAIIKHTFVARLVQNLLVILSFAFFVLVVANWPGGDDGPGMLMIGGVGPALLYSLVLAIFQNFKGD